MEGVAGLLRGVGAMMGEGEGCLGGGEGCLVVAVSEVEDSLVVVGGGGEASLESRLLVVVGWVDASAAVFARWVGRS